MTAGGGSQNTTTGSCWQFLSLSLFYMLLSVVNTHLCCAAVLPVFSPITYVITYSDGLCHPTIGLVLFALNNGLKFQKPF
jgi:hypothetical protein